MTEEKGLSRQSFEHDACGIGAVVRIDGTKSHSVVDNALSIVEKLEHRAGKDASGETGDGVGILVQISHRFFRKAAAEIGITLPAERDYGVGMFFFPQDTLSRNQAKKMLEIIAAKEGVRFLGWREVPVNEAILGKRARDCMPYIMQCFLERPREVRRGLDFDRKLYVIRRVFEQSNDNTYVASMSSRTGSATTLAFKFSASRLSHLGTTRPVPSRSALKCSISWLRVRRVISSSAFT